MDSIDSVIQNGVEIQENGIIRNQYGRLIGRLEDDIKYTSHHVQIPIDKRYTMFRRELRSLLNKHSAENTSNTPDYILAEYLTKCLASFDTAVRARDKFHGYPQDHLDNTYTIPEPKTVKHDGK